MPSFTLSYGEIDKAIAAIAHAKHHGRPVVPLVGAGLSADSGLPTIVDLVRYFAALHYYIRTGAYLPRAWRDAKGGHPLDRRVAAYEKPLEFIKDFNWPDPCQLTQNLRSLPELDRPGQLERTIAEELDRLARKLYPDQVSVLERAPTEPGHGRRSWLWDAVGDWKDLLRYMTDYDPDYTELHFARFHRYHRPGLGHRFLAFLTHILRIPLVLTSPIDSLLEQALTAEGIGHQVFTLHPGRPFPAPGMLHDHLAVLKLHGDASTLLADERHHMSWERDVRRRFRDAFPRDALLLALGYSGRGRLLMSLIEDGVLRLGDRQARPPERPTVVWLHYEEQLPPPVERILAHQPGLAEAVVTAGVKQPGLFLRQLYTALTTRYPASTIPYATHAEQPTLLRRAPEFEDLRRPAGDGALLRRCQNEAGTFVLFNNLRCDGAGRPPQAPPPVRAPSASERLVEWVNDQTSEADLVPIWIDLESQYTLPEVVSAVIDRCRLHDPLLPPSVLPLDDAPGRGPDPTLDEAVERVGEALRRGRYVIAFDSFETFIWPQTAHHGIITKIRDEMAVTRGRLRRLTQFLIKLGKKVCGGAARLGVSVNLPQGRHEGGVDLAVLDLVFGEIRELIRACGLTTERALEDPRSDEGEPPTRLGDPWDGPGGKLRGVLVGPKPDAGEPDAPAGDRAALALLCLSCFRRTRHLVALRSLLEPLLSARTESGPGGYGPGARVDGLVRWYCRQGLLIPLEGGLYWMSRPLRDTIYSENSQHTRTGLFEDLVRGTPLPDPAAVVAQLLLLALHHDRIARYYFFETFLMSRDANAFFEYVYHRVSSIRYLTKLALVLQWHGAREGTRQACTAVRTLFTGRTDSPGHYLAVPQETLDRMEDAETLSVEVQLRRRREICALRLAWHLSRDLLLSLVPSEQLIGWCQWLVDDDLPRFRAQRYLDRARPGRDPAEAGRDPGGWAAVCAKLDAEVQDGIAHLRDDLYALWAECCRNRADHAGAVRQLGARAAEGRGRIPEPWWPVLEAIAGPSGPAPFPWAELVALVGAAGEDRPPWPEGFLEFLLQAAEYGVTAGTEVLPFLDGLLRAMDPDRERRPFLSCLLLTAEAQLDRANRGLRAGAEAEAVSAALTRARAATAKGFQEVRPLMEASDAPDHPYFSYRSRFLLTRGKAARLEAGEAAHPRAYQDFELARGHLKQFGDQTFLAQIDLHAADCALTHADLLLRPGGEFATARSQAEAKYHIADGRLRRAFDHLLRSRNVVWWKEYARLYATHKSARNLLRLAHLVERRRLADAGAGGKLPDRDLRDWCKAEARSFTGTVRQALLSVRRGLNLELARPTNPKLWQMRLCAELLLTALSFGNLACSVLRQDDRQNPTEAWLAYWAWLLETAGLKTAPFPEWLRSGGPGMAKIIDSLLSDTDPLALRTAVCARAGDLLLANGRI